MLCWRADSTDVQHREETLAAMRLLRARLDELERDMLGIDPDPPDEIVQLKPEAHPNFGRALFHVRRVRGGDLCGYLLVPHRAGLTIAVRASDVAPVGTLAYRLPDWSYYAYSPTSPAKLRRCAIELPKKAVEISKNGRTKREKGENLAL